jgi:rRNA maturation RNase YbeY
MISFHCESIVFDFKDDKKFLATINDLLLSEQNELGDVNYIFCSDAYLLEINRRYLSHDYYTDVITFDYTDGKLVSGDIFISIDTVSFNASDLDIDFDKELLRVMFHGVLHLLGYKDKSDEDIAKMRSAEDRCLSFFYSF